MKAAFAPRYGSPDVLTVADTPTPTPAANEMRIAVEAAAVTTADWRLRASAFPGGLWLPGRLMMGLFRPKNPVLGLAYAGTVDAIGPEMRGFSIGDAVFGFSPTGGAHADHLVTTADGPVALAPKGLSSAQAAALPWGAISALVFLRDVAGLRPGERVLIVGASGGVGAPATQIALDMGAHVTAVAGPANQRLLADLGAPEIVDYTRTDLTTLGQRFDVVFDTVGAMSYAQARRVLAPGGRFVPLNFGLKDIAQSLTDVFRKTRIKIAVSADSRDDLLVIRDMAERGALQPIIDSAYPLDQIAAAHARVETRHASGTVIVTPGAQMAA